MSGNHDHDHRELQFLAEMAEHCFCCADCIGVPCPVVTAGGFCDRSCVCEAEEYDHDYDETGPTAGAG